MIDSTIIKTIVKQQISNTLDAYEANRNKIPKHKEGENDRSSIQSNHNAYTYIIFIDNKPISYYGDKGIVVLTHWIMDMKSILQNHDCAKHSWVKLATCIFTDGALRWWNTNVKTLGVNVDFAIPLEDIKRKMVAEFHPRGEILIME